MRTRSILLAGAIALLIPALAHAAGPYKAPTDAWGKPSLEGNWTNTSLTRLERDAQYGARQEMTPAEVKKLEGDRQAEADRDKQKTQTSGTEQLNTNCEIRGFPGGATCAYN